MSNFLVKAELAILLVYITILMDLRKLGSNYNWNDLDLIFITETIADLNGKEGHVAHAQWLAVDNR